MDEKEFLKNLKGCEGALFNFLLRILNDREEAKEAMQTTVLKAWESRNGFEGRSQFKTWIFRIAINAAMDLLRQKKDFQLEPHVYGASQTPFDLVSRKEERQRLLEAIAQLPERQKRVLLLKFYGELKYSEIATLMRLTEGTVKAHFHHAITRLKEVLKADEV